MGEKKSPYWGWWGGETNRVFLYQGSWVAAQR